LVDYQKKYEEAINQISKVEMEKSVMRSSFRSQQIELQQNVAQANAENERIGLMLKDKMFQM
jgi:hypothetical protein